MKNACSPIATALLLAALFMRSTAAQAAYPGYNFYSSGKYSYLTDLSGATVHRWTCNAGPVMSHAHLLRDSSVIFPYFVPNTGFSSGTIPEGGGGFQIIRWDGTIAWSYTYYDSSYLPHHDVEPVYYTNDISEVPSIFVVCATTENTNGVMSEKIIELQPKGPSGAVIKWVWYAYDHSTSSGNGQAQLLDLNLGYGWPGSKKQEDWLHANQISYNPRLDQLIVGLNWMEEFIIIDHSTTTEQAAGHTGGNDGKGGDILYRWGCPSNYGCSGTNYLVKPHGAGWIPNCMPGTGKKLPGAGHVLDISNFTKKAYEIAVPAGGVYTRAADSAYAPAMPCCSISVDQGSDQGSIQRLPNGNTLICRGTITGSVEFDPAGNPIDTYNVQANALFRIDSAFLGSTLLDTPSSASAQLRPAAVAVKAGAMQLTYATSSRAIRFIVGTSGGCCDFAVYSPQGKCVLRRRIRGNELLWDARKTAKGVYFIRAVSGAQSAMGRFIPVAD